LVLASLLAWVGVPTSLHADESEVLRRAIARFDAGDYVGAQELLTGIDRSQLTAEEQALRDDYLNRSQTAITMYEKAVRDLDDAETAMDEKEPDRARRLLLGVLSNEYAAGAVRRSAESMLADLDQTDGIPPEPVVVIEALPPAPPVNGERSRALTREADNMLLAGQLDVAERLYREALISTPGYPEAEAGLRRVAEHRRNISGERAESLIQQIRRDQQINWQRTVAEFREAQRIVREHVAAERFDEAREMLVRTSQIVEAGKQFADPVSDYETLRAEANALAEWVRSEERSYNERRVAEIRAQIEQERSARLQRDAENRRCQVETLMAQAMQHRKDGELDEAITVLKQVTVIDPKYHAARWMLDELEEIRQFRRARADRDTFYEESQKALQDVEEAKIPWHVELRYPENWAELTARPERSKSSSRGPDRHLYGALEKPVPVDFKGVPFEQVIERLTENHRLNIIVNWHDLKRAGIERSVPIDLSLPTEITLQKVLTEVLDQAGGGRAALGYNIADGTMKIATQATLDQETYTAVYDIQDLLMEIPIFNDSPMMDLGHAYQRQKANLLAAEQRQMPWRFGDDDDDEQDENPERQSRIDKIINLIEETVAPDSWVERGGTVGTIKEINGQLVITQNSSAQRQIGDLLGKLREQRAVQIAVEARFITVSSHYLEELGIDIDVVLNSGNAGFDYVPGAAGPLTDTVTGQPLLLPRSFSRIGVTPAVPGVGNPTGVTPAPIPQPYGQPAFVPQQGNGSGSQLTPVPILNRISSFTDPTNLGSDVPGSFAGQTLPPAFSLFGSFLDNIQVDFLVRATEADSRTSVLTAPRLVLFNGQRSWVAVTIQQGYVSQLTPVVATGAVAQAPQTATIDSGAVLDVTATVTADKRYVTMTVRPGVTRLLDLQTIPFSGGASGGGFGGGTANNAFIQLPTLSSHRVQTTVSVPDGGTLLIGGQKLAAETEIEAGVPVLSKIPILKRAYSSRTMIKDEQTLLILIKPKIFIQTEQEELAFPAFRGG